MEILKVNGYDLEVGYSEELEVHMDKFTKPRTRGEKLQACSPFREEKHPSFAVNLDNGSWVDSGASEEQGRKGSFVTLLAFFREESYEDTAEYLLEKYSHILDDADILTLEMGLQLEIPEVSVLGQAEYADVVGKPSEYLRGRGISNVIQKCFETGLGSNGDCIALPWHDKFGRIINIKFRSIKGKEFWFIKNGQPIKNHVYGLWGVIRGKYKEVWAVESEIDALYLWSKGIPAIAFGGASLNAMQKSLILNSCIETLVVATDNDIVGQRFGNVLGEEFMGHIEVEKINIPTGKKDVNELGDEELKQCIKDKKKITLLLRGFLTSQPQ